MISCEAVQEFLLEAHLGRTYSPEGRLDAGGLSRAEPSAIDDAALVGTHLEVCVACTAFLRHIAEASEGMALLLDQLAATVGPLADPAAARESVRLVRPRITIRWRVLLPLVAATLAGVALLRPGDREVAPFAGGPEWTLPVANLRSIQPVVVSSSSHSNVAVLPTDNPNITIVWFMD